MKFYYHPVKSNNFMFFLGSPRNEFPRLGVHSEEAWSLLELVRNKSNTVVH